MSSAPERSSPSIIRFLAINAIGGAVIGFLAAGALIASDLGGLATLMSEAGSHLVASTLLFGGFGLTFGGLAMASAVMLLPRA